MTFEESKLLQAFKIRFELEKSNLATFFLHVNTFAPLRLDDACGLTTHPSHHYYYYTSSLNTWHYDKFIIR